MAIYKISGLQINKLSYPTAGNVEIENINSGQTLKFTFTYNFNITPFIKKHFELEDFLTELQKSNG